MDFLPSPAVFAAYSLAAFILTITPGPDMTLFLSRALTQGRMAGLVAILGASSGLVVHTMAAAFGLSALIAASPEAFFAIKLAGAVYLVWLAYQAVRHGSALTLETGVRSRQPLLQTWFTAFGINLLNPKIVLFFLTFLPQFVSAEDPNATGKLAFLGFYFIMFALPICGAMVLAADQFSRVLRGNRRVARAIDFVFAGVFGAFAVKILLTRSS